MRHFARFCPHPVKNVLRYRVCFFRRYDLFRELHPFLKISLFLFLRNFWKTIMLNPAKRSFLFLRELEGLTPAPPNAPYPPPVCPSPSKRTAWNQQSREGLDLHSKLYMISRYTHIQYHIFTGKYRYYKLYLIHILYN